ncbi:MAG: hypothetical protein M3198_00925 [Actinomycetota bacterium]|nr:hypothetical protein [Actinomycetota bacterium]
MRSIGRSNSRRWSLVVSVAMFALLLIPFAGPAAANHGSRVLDVTPDTASRGVGAQHMLTAKLCTFPAPPNPDAEEDPDSVACVANPATFGTGPINIDFEFEPLSPPFSDPSANDPDNGASFATPDLTCSIAAGESQCTVQYTGNVAGDDQIRAWIDHDGRDETTSEIDMVEQQDERAVPGSQPTGPPDTSPDCTAGGPAEEDCTDVVTVSWTGGAPANLDCDDSNGPDRERETNPSGGPQGNETYTCRATDAQGNATGDANPNEDGTQPLMVNAEITNGVNDPDSPDGASYETPDYQCRTGAGRGGSDPPTGQCSITVTQGELETGTADICFWIGDATEGQTRCADEPTGENQNETTGEDTGNDLADRTELTWVARSSQGGGVDAEPETADRIRGGNHTITATVYDQFNNPFNGNTEVKFEFFDRSPKDTDGNTPGAPDETCTTQNSSSCSITYSSSETGRDLVCVWTNDAPTMTGDVDNGQCGGEGQVDQDDTAGTADAPDPVDDDQDVVSATWRNAEPATELNCEPENGKTERSSNHVITCTASNENGGVGGTEIDAEATGANDPDGSSSPGDPDFTCTTDNDGDCQITHNGSADNEKGETTYRVWIDKDYNSNTNESDASEGQNEENDGGGTDEPDNTDVVKNRWVADSDRTITLASNRTKQDEGKRVRFFGDIEGDPSCEDAETVKLRRARLNDGPFKTIATTTTDTDGSYEFEIVIRKSRRYKAVAPATTTPDACDKAKSNTVTVTVTR